MPNYGARLSSSTVVAALDWTPTAQFESIVDQYLSADERVRAELSDIVRTYIQHAEFERNGAPAGDAAVRLAELKTSAERFWMATQGSEAVHQEAVTRIDALINDYAAPRGFTVDKVVQIMTIFVSACDEAERAIKEERFSIRDFTPGTSWNRLLVWEVKDLWAGLGKKVSARKDASSQRPGGQRESPFVCFLWELQECLPDQFRQSTHSLEAFSKAVSKALSAKPKKRA